jgi:CRISPR associated protein Cas1
LAALAGVSAPLAWIMPQSLESLFGTPQRLGNGPSRRDRAAILESFRLASANAVLNYSGAVVIAQLTRTCAGLGLDPAFGVLHSARPGMTALPWDCLELLRVQADAACFDYMAKHVFKADDFKIEREPKPHLRFNAAIARDVAEFTLRRVTFSECVRTVRKVAAWF